MAREKDPPPKRSKKGRIGQARFDASWHKIPRRRAIGINFFRMLMAGHVNVTGVESLLVMLGESAGVSEARGRIEAMPGLEAFGLGLTLGRQLAALDGATRAGAVAGIAGRNPRGETLKGRLIRNHLGRRPGDCFAAYWRALCEPSEHIGQFLEAWGARHWGEKAGVVKISSKDGKSVEIKKAAHRRYFYRIKRELRPV